MPDKCGFAYPGTWGHECGRPALFVALMKSELTKSGIFYAKRCAEHKDMREPYDSAILSVEDFDATKHINQWR